MRTGWNGSTFQSTHPAWDVTLATSLSLPSFNGFQSTHPAWDVTVQEPAGRPGPAISIHTSRMGCDLQPFVLLHDASYFNPHIPHGM